MISNQARQQNLNCNLDVDNRSGVGSVECEVRRNPLEYTRVHSFSQSVSWFQLQAHGYHMAPFKRFPVGRATLGKKRKKKLWKQIQLKKKRKKIRCRDPIDRATPVPIVFCGSSIIMTRWWWCNRPMPHPLFPLLRNHQAATFCLICSYADRFLLIFCDFRPTLCQRVV